MKRILLVYIGREQGAWGTIAFPRPQHYYLMPGIRYCAATLAADPHLAAASTIECLYCNESVQTEDDMIRAIEQYAPDILGFSVFCWNRERSMNIAAALKQTRPDLLILAGGPEFYLTSVEQVDALFAAHQSLDAVLFGEAEVRLPALVRFLLDRNESHLEGLSGYACSPRLGGSVSIQPAAPPTVEQIPSAYPLPLDVPLSKHGGLAVVYESVRGCPYECIYCQFGRRDRCIRELPVERLEPELRWLLKHEVACLHIADAVFDLKPERAKTILRLLLKHNRRTSLFCYCAFFHLDDELASLFSQAQVQIDVGVQSTNHEVLRTLRRALSPRLFHDIRQVLDRHHLNFYIDLIFGLPGDTMESFERSFNETIGLDPAFIMLFPLTRISGTRLFDQLEHYGIVNYGPDDLKPLDLQCDIEYVNIGLHRNFGPKDLERFDDLALACFYFYNRFRNCMRHLARRHPAGAVALYHETGARTKAFLRLQKRRASNTDSLSGFDTEIRAIFDTQLDTCGSATRERGAFDELHKLDILSLLLRESPERERQFRRVQALRSSNAASPRVLRAGHGKIVTLSFDYGDLLALHTLRETIEPKPTDVYLHCPFEHADVSVVTLDELTRAILELTPFEQPRPLQSLLNAIRRRQTGSECPLSEDQLRQTISDMERNHLLTVA